MALPIWLTSLIPDLVKTGVDFVDKKWTTEAEKEAAVRDYLQNAWDKEQTQLTERHKQDMISDSWLSKNIRPLVLVYLIFLFTLAFFRDVPQPILQMLQDLLMTSFVFYFGARTIEKVAGIVKK